jgi:hypothetical protein
LNPICDWKALVSASGKRVYGGDRFGADKRRESALAICERGRIEAVVRRDIVNSERAE